MRGATRSTRRSTPRRPWPGSDTRTPSSRRASVPCSPTSSVSASIASRLGRAPGRLDLLGGVADYSGALVLEMPTSLQTTVVADPDDALVVGPATLSTNDVVDLAQSPYDEVRAALAQFPKWTHYVLGVAIVLVRHGVIDPPRA